MGWKMKLCLDEEALYTSKHNKSHNSDHDLEEEEEHQISTSLVCLEMDSRIKNHQDKDFFDNTHKLFGFLHTLS